MKQMPSQPEEGSQGTTAGRGETVLLQIVALKSEMKSALERIDSMLINFSEAQAAVPTYRQAVCRTHTTMTALKKALQQINSPTSQEDAAGPVEKFTRHVGCPLECQDHCVWEA